MLHTDTPHKIVTNTTKMFKINSSVALCLRDDTSEVMCKALILKCCIMPSWRYITVNVYGVNSQVLQNAFVMIHHRLCVKR